MDVDDFGMTVPNQLKPCPFCNTEFPYEEGIINSVFDDVVDDLPIGYHTRTIGTGQNLMHPSLICCPGCGCSVVGGETAQEAIRNWNNRPIEDECQSAVDSLRDANEQIIVLEAEIIYLRKVARTFVDESSEDALEFALKNQSRLTTSDIEQE